MSRKPSKITELEQELRAIGFNSLIRIENQEGELEEFPMESNILGLPCVSITLKIPEQNLVGVIREYQRGIVKKEAVLTAMTTLSLSLHGDFSPENLTALLKWMQTKVIREIDITKADISAAENLMILKELPRHAETLKKLTLLFPSADGTDEANRLAELSRNLPLLTKLEVLDFSHSKIRNACWPDLAAALSNLRELRLLNLSDNDLGDQEIETLAQRTLPLCRKLTYLYLDCNDIGPRGTELLVASLSRSTRSLEALDLSGNNIEDHGARALADLITHLNLSELIIFSNHIRDEGAIAIANALKISELEYLDISDNDFLDPAILAFAEALAKSPPLLLLCCGVTGEYQELRADEEEYDLISDESAIALAKAMMRNNTLHDLTILENDGDPDHLRSPEVARAFAKAIFAREYLIKILQENNATRIPSPLTVPEFILPDLSPEERDEVKGIVEMRMSRDTARTKRRHEEEREGESRGRRERTEPSSSAAQASISESAKKEEQHHL